MITRHSIFEHISTFTAKIFSIFLLLFLFHSACTDLDLDVERIPSYIPDDWSREGFNGIWGTSENNLFIVGTAGTLLHFDGAEWNQMSSPASKTLTSVWGSSSDNIFAVGADATILHYNGSDWTVMDSPVSESLNSIWGNTRDHIFAVGSAGSIIEFDGSKWQVMDKPTDDRLNSIWGTSNDDIFTVSSAGRFSIIMEQSGKKSHPGKPLSIRFGVLHPPKFLLWDLRGASIFMMEKNGNPCLTLQIKGYTEYGEIRKTMFMQ